MSPQIHLSRVKETAPPRLVRPAAEYRGRGGSLQFSSALHMDPNQLPGQPGNRALSSGLKNAGTPAPLSARILESAARPMTRRRSSRARDQILADRITVCEETVPTFDSQSQESVSDRNR